eukprot:g5011.t1
MEGFNDDFKDQILRTISESATGELSSRDIAERIKNANLSQVEGVLKKILIPGQLCIEQEKKQGTVYKLTTEGRRHFAPRSLSPPSPRIEQPRPLTNHTMELHTNNNNNNNNNNNITTSTNQFQRVSQTYYMQQPPVQFYQYPNAHYMGFVPGPYHPAQAQPSVSYLQQMPMAGYQPRGKKSALRVKPARTVESNVQTSMRKPSKEKPSSSLKTEDSEKIKNFLLNETRKIRSQGKAIDEMMSRPFASGRLSNTPPPSGSFLDRKTNRSQQTRNQTLGTLHSLTTMGPPPEELQLTPRGKNKSQFEEDNDDEEEEEEEEEDDDDFDSS